MEMQQLLPEGAASRCCWQVYWGTAAALLFPKKCAGICIFRMPFLVDKNSINERTQEVKLKDLNGIFWIWVHWTVGPLRCSFRTGEIPSAEGGRDVSVCLFETDPCFVTLKDYEHGMEALKKAPIHEGFFGTTHFRSLFCAQIQFQNEVKPQFGTQGAQAHHSHRTTLRLPGVRCRCRFGGFLDRWLNCLYHKIS